jgi:ADP-ribose pyrophosphatase/ADP-sugar pyrophosphatase/8-oxo-dGDP phosphatase
MYRPAVERYCIEFPSGSAFNEEKAQFFFINIFDSKGLIDADEGDPINAAQRELKEETGYLVAKEKFELIKVPVAYEPGLTNSSCYVAKVTIDVTELTEAPVQKLEQDEWSLQTLSLPLDGLLKRLLGRFTTIYCCIGHAVLTNSFIVLLELESQYELLVIDSRVHALASGLAYAKEYNNHFL